MTLLANYHTIEGGVFITARMNRKVLLLGFIVVIIVAIPVTIALVYKNSNNRSKAAASTNLSFSTLTGPVGIGSTFSLNVLLDPGQNQVSFVKLMISYDSSKITPTSQGIVPNSSVFPVTLEGPTYGQCTGTACTETITMSIGTEVTKAIQGAGSPVTIANLNFNAVAATDPTNGTPIGIANGTQVLSLASTDQPSENVLSAIPSPVNVIVATTLNGTPTGDVTPTDTPTPTIGPSITPGGSGTTPSPTAQNPICTSLTADNTSTASAPFTVNFTANGTDPNTNGTISKVTFNFGDGSVQDITSAGGIGTATVNAQVSHTYQTNGLYSATATLFDSSGSTSNPTTCTQTISVGSVVPLPTNGIYATPTPTPTLPVNRPLPPTGPGDILVNIGIIGAVITVLGITVAAFGL